MERDWGANVVAEELARALGLAGYYRVNIARVLMDFGRFPGITPRNAEHLHRYAINYPFSKLLSYQQKKHLFERVYDPMSRLIEDYVRHKFLKIAIHTYDTHNPSGTLRPPTSLVTRSVSIQRHSEMPLGVFDPLYPDILAEFTADRILRDRISLTLEKANISVAHNYPYSFPEGSIEVRSQVWFFFNYVRECFEARHPESRDDDAFQRVWQMLLDTNLRDSSSDALRSYIHLFRRAPDDERDLYARARAAYEQVADFVEADNRAVVSNYRFASERPSSIGIEVRKDLVWEFDEHGQPKQPRFEAARHVARVIAQAVITYLNEDKPVHEHSVEGYPRSAPWYARDLGRL